MSAATNLFSALRIKLIITKLDTADNDLRRQWKII